APIEHQRAEVDDAVVDYELRRRSAVGDRQIVDDDGFPCVDSQNRFGSLAVERGCAGALERQAMSNLELTGAGAVNRKRVPVARAGERACERTGVACAVDGDRGRRGGASRTTERDDHYPCDEHYPA